MPNPRTPADEMFERYLAAHAFQFQYEPDIEAELAIETSRRPDYLVVSAVGRAICEVKQLETRTLSQRTAGQTGAFFISDKEQFGPLRASIIDKAEQLRPLAGTGTPLVIVLANSPAGSDFALDDEHVLSALWGNPKITFTIDRSTGAAVGGPQNKLSDYGVLCSRQPDGTWANVHPHIAAVVTLHERTLEQDWIGERFRERGHPLPDLAAALAQAKRRDVEIEEARAAGEIPQGTYQWVEVYDTDGAEADPLPTDLFAGARDRRFGFFPDHTYGER